ncbi:MAG: M15 family metallopeptidase [Bacteroidales bacterium]|jgi:D-alanyl-D-alanine dipeptidase|nr:M15 family metallopeptidase [Bacteroidales bacterium]
MPNSRLILIIFYCFFILFLSCNQHKTPDTNDEKNTTIHSEEIKDTIRKVVLIPEKNNIEKKLEEMGLVKILDSIPEIIVELKYASNDNFIGFDFYGELINAYSQPECLEKLKNAYYILQEKLPGYTFIIYDAVRSIESQQLMWDSIKVPEKNKFWYVADPQKGSIHNYGMALDLTIADENGIPLDMGTKFDYFGELAFPDKTDYFYKNGELNKDQYENRNLLMSIMKNAGFIVSKTEWWHYNASSLNDAKNKYKIFSIND